MKWLLAAAAVIALVVFWRRKTLAPGGGSIAQPYQSQPGVPDRTGISQLDSMAEAIGRFEGYNVPGSLAARTNNPGDIATYGSKVSSYASVDDGWSALKSYIAEHATANPDWDFYDFFRYYLTGSSTGTPGPNQNPDEYAEFVANYVGVAATTPLISLMG